MVRELVDYDLILDQRVSFIRESLVSYYYCETRPYLNLISHPRWLEDEDVKIQVKNNQNMKEKLIS
jgi:hypothetical protein